MHTKTEKTKFFYAKESKQKRFFRKKKTLLQICSNVPSDVPGMFRKVKFHFITFLSNNKLNTIYFVYKICIQKSSSLLFFSLLSYHWLKVIVRITNQLNCYYNSSSHQQVQTTRQILYKRIETGKLKQHEVITKKVKKHFKT